MADLIEKANDNPDVASTFEGETSDIKRLFGSEEGLLLSLQQRWLTALTARLDQAAHRGIPLQWAIAGLEAQHSGLRALLTMAAQRSMRVRILQRDERRIMDLYDGHMTTWQTIA